MTDYNDDREVTYEIVEEIGIISSASTGWKKELNVVAWNGGQGKYDIREWSPNHDRMSRGITLNEQEMRTIIDLLKRRSRAASRRSSRRTSSEPMRAYDEPEEETAVQDLADEQVMGDSTDFPDASAYEEDGREAIAS